MISDGVTGHEGSEGMSCLAIWGEEFFRERLPLNYESFEVRK